MTIAVKATPVKKVAPGQEQVQKPAAQKEKAAQKVVAPVNDVLTQVTSPETSIIVKVDTMVELKDELEAMKPKAKTFDEAKKFLQSVADADGVADQPVEVMGTGGNKVVFGAKCDQTQITDRAGLLTALKAKFVEAAGGDAKQGYENLLGFVQIPLGDLNKYFTEVELAQFVAKTKATGPRALKAVLKGQG